MFVRWLLNWRLHRAAVRGDISSIASLIGAGADPNSQREYGFSDRLRPLHAAILRKQTDAVVTLIKNGADPNLRCLHWSQYLDRWTWSNETESDWSALHLAVEAGDSDLLRLIAQHTPIDVRTSLGRSPLHHAAEIARSNAYSYTAPVRVGILQLLIGLGADVGARDMSGKTPLFFASRTNGSLGAMISLLHAGADVNARDNQGQTPLFWADGEGVVELLLEWGADPMIRDVMGWRAIACARFAGIHASKVGLLEKYDRD